MFIVRAILGALLGPLMDGDGRDVPLAFMAAGLPLRPPARAFPAAGAAYAGSISTI